MRENRAQYQKFVICKTPSIRVLGPGRWLHHHALGAQGDHRLFKTRTEWIAKQNLVEHSWHSANGVSREQFRKKTVVNRVFERIGAGRCSELLMRARRVVTVQQLALSFFELFYEIEVLFTDESMGRKRKKLMGESFGTLEFLSEIHDSPRENW